MKESRKFLLVLCAGALALACLAATELGNGLSVGGGNATITKILSGSATLDFGTNFIESVETLQISVPGAAVGDVVALGCPLDIAGSTNGAFYAFASNDFVYVRAIHHYAATWDPLSGVYKVIVFK